MRSPPVGRITENCFGVGVNQARTAPRNWSAVRHGRQLRRLRFPSFQPKHQLVRSLVPAELNQQLSRLRKADQGDLSV